MVTDMPTSAPANGKLINYAVTIRPPPLPSAVTIFFMAVTIFFMAVTINFINWKSDCITVNMRYSDKTVQLVFEQYSIYYLCRV